ncbi:complex I subunit 5 family protein [Geomonas ferrireducens]|uniref:complex I subunit 5 family protein n=1 Tax=Geomonas ferrireducens TaxID=2570227 RepID=UPI0010A7A9A3|nr:complex I subunit 5 family protein [Geomonas ferrireducens]
MNTPPLPVVLPLFMAALLAALEQLRSRRRVLDVLSLLTALAVVVFDLLLLERSLAATLVYWFGDWSLMRGFPVGIAFVIDPAAALLALLASLLTVAALLFSWHHFHAVRTYYHTLMLLFLASLQGFALTGDLFNMFVFFELMGVAAYALTGYKIEESGPLEGGLNFAVMNSLGGLMVLLGIGLLYAKTGGLNLAWIGAALHGKPVTAPVGVAFMLLSVGFLVKGAVFPFHFWLPDAHSVAPTPASVLFSGIMVQLGLYAVARIYWVVFSDVLAQAPVQSAFLGIGIVTLLAGGAMACLQRHLKRLLAYSTVSHSGLILAGFALHERQALEGTLLYIFGHGLIKGGLFIATGILVYHFRSVDEKQLHGKCRRLKITGVLFLLAGLALAGLPPFGTWAGKGIIEESARGLGYGWLVPFFALGSVLTGGAVLRAGGGIFFGLGHLDPFSSSAPASGEEGAEAEKSRGPTPVIMILPMALLLLSSLGVGLLPQGQQVAALAAARFVDRDGYRHVVLAGERRMTPPLSRVARPGLGGGLIAAAGAVALATLFLAPGPLHGRATKRIKSIVRGPVVLLRRVHSGYIGDYVVWFTVGTAALTLLALLSW